MRLLIIVGFLIFGTTSIDAKKPNKKGHSHHLQESSAVSYKDDHVSVSVSLFSTNETALLTHYRSNQKGQKRLPKGLQMKMARGGALPPGWQKKLSRGAVIDKKTYQHARPLTDDILIQLPPAPSGTIIVEIDGEIVRLVEATLTIVDILKHH